MPILGTEPIYPINNFLVMISFFGFTTHLHCAFHPDLIQTPSRSFFDHSLNLRYNLGFRSFLLCTYHVTTYIFLVCHSQSSRLSRFRTPTIPFHQAHTLNTSQRGDGKWQHETQEIQQICALLTYYFIITYVPTKYQLSSKFPFLFSVHLFHYAMQVTLFPLLGLRSSMRKHQHQSC